MSWMHQSYQYKIVLIAVSNSFRHIVFTQTKQQPVDDSRLVCKQSPESIWQFRKQIAFKINDHQNGMILP